MNNVNKIEVITCTNNCCKFERYPNVWKGFKMWKNQYDNSPKDYNYSSFHHNHHHNQSRNRMNYQSPSFAAFSSSSNNNSHRVRAGIVLYDIDEDRVLLIQNYGQFFGIPKGGKECGETLIECAIREVMEETGVVLTSDILSNIKPLVYDNTAYYYVVPVKMAEMKSDINKISANDSTGLGWIKLGCIDSLKKYGVITKHCKMIIEYLQSKYDKVSKAFSEMNITQK